MPCFIKPDMHHTWLCIMPCLCLCIYHVVCFFLVLLLSSGNVAVVRIRSTTPVRLLHGIVLLPTGISGKMTVTLDLITIFAMPVASFFRYAALPINCSSSLPKFPCQSLTFSPFLANHCLAMLPLCSAPLIALLVAGEVEDCSMMDRIMLGYHNISYLINAHIYLVKGGRPDLLPGVFFHSCRPSFCHTGVMFLDFASLTRWRFMGPSW